MHGFPWLTVIGAVPLAGALALVAIPGLPADADAARGAARDRLAKQVALAASVVTLAFYLAMASRFAPGGPTFQFTETVRWIPEFGVHYALGVDGIALVLMGMSVALMPFVILSSWHDVDPSTPEAGGAEGSEGSAPRAHTAERRGSAKTYLALMLVLETMVVGVFAATDVFLFYILFEAMLIPMYFMIGKYGVGRRQYAALKFLLYNLFGGLLMLAAVIALYVLSARSPATGHHGTFLLSGLVQVAFSPLAQKFMFLGFMFAFAVKAPLWPFHTWLPDATSSAQPGAAVVMIGVMDKVGTFGMIRYCLQLFPGAATYFSGVIIVLAVIGILYGAVVAIGQADLRRLVAHSSVSHTGFIVLGIFAFTTQGESGATFFMVNTGFATGALLLIIGFLMTRRGSARIADFGGVQKVAPVLAGLFLVAGLANLSLPGVSTFVSEFLVTVGTFSRHRVAGVFAVGGMILAAVYILWMYQRTMNGPTVESLRRMPDLKARELLAVVPLVGLLVAMGVYPKPVLDAINPAVRHTMSVQHVTDPPPAHPAGSAHSGSLDAATVARAGPGDASTSIPYRSHLTKGTAP